MSKSHASQLIPNILGLAFAVGSVVAVAACSGKQAAGTDSSTHWLEECSSDADCVDNGLSCIGGYCRSPNAGSGGSAGSVGGAGGTATGGSSGSGGSGGSSETGGSGNATAAGGTSGSDGGSGAVAGGASGTAGSDASGGSAGGTGGSGGEAGATDPPVECAPMDARGENPPCMSTARFVFTGGVCMPFKCESCVGDDCGSLYATSAECDKDHGACYAELGLSQACDDDTDCVLVRRGCCGACGINGEENLMGLSVNAESSYLEICSSIACAACSSADDPKAYTHCSQGFCAVSTMP